VRLEQRAQVRGEEAVAVPGDEHVVPGKRSGEAAQPAAGSLDDGLVHRGDGEPATCTLLPGHPGHHLGKVVGVERHAVHPGPGQHRKRAPEQWRAEEGHRRLRVGVGQRAKAGPQSRGEDERSDAWRHQRSSGT
jgi:hypothetical protein